MLFAPDDTIIAAIDEQCAAQRRISQIRECANEGVDKALAPRIEALRKIMRDAGYPDVAIEAYADHTGRASFTLMMLEDYRDGT